MDRNSVEYLEKIGIERTSPMKAIRRKCLDCMGGSSIAIDECSQTCCNLWPFRKGKNPWRAPASEAQIAAAKKNAASLMAKRA